MCRFIRVAAVLAEGLADGFGGVGGEGVGGRLKAALPAEGAGDNGGNGIERAGFAAADAPIFSGLLSLIVLLYGGFDLSGIVVFDGRLKESFRR
ncbi:hypothetical protein LVJ83_04950 [Uruburuella testudinis]|uniref:Uncharacterized protein n=1 Tax=Uruburuella testudinis TaxID=1282863 RepID=A0ABY4DUU9_9NEIS|nr:hypothetical protein [Uruburuella testudinis]UOO82816.1 hypothetical protein LVJ83_04950 [Uruburuella testudinis]